MREESTKAVVRAVLAAIDRHDLPALQAHPGLHETVQHIPLMWAAFPDLRHTVERQIADGDMVATCATVRGTHRGPLLGAPPTGKEVAFLVLMMNQIVDGRIVLHYGLPDWMALLGPLGVLPSLAHG
jgi:predicted ester cyclase